MSKTFKIILALEILIFIVTMISLSLSNKYYLNFRIDIPDPRLSEWNTGLKCQDDTDCYTGGCGGELCGGGCSICFRSKEEIPPHIRNEECSCVLKKCRWSIPLINLDLNIRK